MTDRDVIILGGGQSTPEPPPNRRRTASLVLAGLLALGLATAVVVAANREPAAPSPEAVELAEQIRERSSLSLEEVAPQLREPQARPERRSPGLPLNQLVDGFEDLLIVSHVNDAGDPFIQVLWAPGANAAARTSSFDNAVFDISGNYFARFERSKWNTNLLAIGDLSSEVSGPVAIGADGFVWHDMEKARIAYTAEIEVGRRALFTADAVAKPRDSELIVEYITDVGGARLVAFGDFGFVLESDGEVIVLGPSGADLGRGPYGFLGLDHDGALLLRTADGVVRSDLALTEFAPPAWLTRVSGTVERVVASPFRPLVAIEAHEPSGTAVYVASSEDVVRLELGEVTVHRWASGGRYLIMSRDEGRKSVLVFYDADSDEVYELPMTDKVDAVFTRAS